MDIQKIGHVMTWTLDAPPVNSISESSLLAMERSLLELDADRGDVRVLVITGAGRFFSAGVDLTLVQENMERQDGADRMVEFIARVQAAYAAIEALLIPTVCIINGNALGGGFELALACDLRIASAGAQIGLPEITLGLLPGAGGTQRLPRLVGSALALRLIMRGEALDGAEAERLGLVHWVVSAGETAAFGSELAMELAGRSPVSLAAIKRCIRLSSTPGGGYVTELETTHLLMSDDIARGEVTDFFSRRQSSKTNRTRAGSE
ncbi:enoyl-CoA hydratase/isomerase family protein [Cryobacterium glaciale]|nr:enoyl-CoA hydratase/isomerase family protein [Cryobacterium glaciale]